METEPPSSMVWSDATIHLKPNVGPSSNNFSSFLGNHVQIFPEPLSAQKNSQADCTELLTDFKNEMQQTNFQKRHLVQVEVPVHSLLLNITNTKKRVRKCTNRIKKGWPYHETFAVIFSSSLLQIEDDQWPHRNDVGHNVHKMTHTQIFCQRSFLRAGWDDIESFQPIYNELSHCKSF